MSYFETFFKKANVSADADAGGGGGRRRGGGGRGGGKFQRGR